MNNNKKISWKYTNVNKTYKTNKQTNSNKNSQNFLYREENLVIEDAWRAEEPVSSGFSLYYKNDEQLRSVAKG